MQIYRCNEFKNWRKIIWGENKVMTEAETRKIIDEQLCKVGWEADTDNLRYSKGTRPHIIIDHTARYFFFIIIMLSRV